MVAVCPRSHTRLFEQRQQHVPIRRSLDDPAVTGPHRPVRAGDKVQPIRVMVVAFDPHVAHGALAALPLVIVLLPPKLPHCASIDW